MQPILLTSKQLSRRSGLLTAFAGRKGSYPVRSGRDEERYGRSSREPGCTGGGNRSAEGRQFLVHDAL